MTNDCLKIHFTKIMISFHFKNKSISYQHDLYYNAKFQVSYRYKNETLKFELEFLIVSTYAFS